MVQVKLLLIVALSTILLNACAKKNAVQDPKKSTVSQNLNAAISQGQEEISASFAIFIGNEFRVFTASMYHNRSATVFIEKDNPNVVLVTNSQTTWQDFFDTLPMKLNADCITTGTGETFCTNTTKQLKFYINGDKDKDALKKVIKRGDLLLISYGSENQDKIDIQIQKLQDLENN